MEDSAKAPSSPAANSPSKSPSARVSSPPAASNPTHDTVPLAVDENPDVAYDDLSIDDGVGSDSTSIKSSILRYRKENGRTYHAYKDGAYVLPNDEAENERLNLQHAIFLLTFDDRLHCAPLKKRAPRVLDAGCGTGIWSIEFADEHPDAHVTGVDLSPIQPAFVPPNVEFLVDDIEEDWSFRAPFDFIFARFMTGSVQDWPRFFKQSFENLSPGGFIELQDCIYPMSSDDDTLSEDTALYEWSTTLSEAFRRSKRPIDSALHYEQQLAEAGFVNIRVVREVWPINPWPRDSKYKQLGIWNSVNTAEALNAATLAIFTRPEKENGLGWSRAEVEVLLARVRSEMKKTDIHAYLRIWAVTAQKPE